MWVNLDNVTHMIGDDNVGTTVLFFGSAEKRLIVLDIPEYLLSKTAEKRSQKLIRDRDSSDADGRAEAEEEEEP